MSLAVGNVTLNLLTTLLWMVFSKSFCKYKWELVSSEHVVWTFTGSRIKENVKLIVTYGPTQSVQEMALPLTETVS